MSKDLWFFTSMGRINCGSKPSVLASFVVLTRTESEIEFQEKVTNFDLSRMGYNGSDELSLDPDYNSKIRIYVREKYSSPSKRI